MSPRKHVLSVTQQLTLLPLTLPAMRGARLAVSYKRVRNRVDNESMPWHRKYTVRKTQLFFQKTTLWSELCIITVNVFWVWSYNYEPVLSKWVPRCGNTLSLFETPWRGGDVRRCSASFQCKSPPHSSSDLRRIATRLILNSLLPSQSSVWIWRQEQS